MTRQWIRKLRIQIGDFQTELSAAPDARDDHGLRVRFVIKDTTLQTPRVADITITNPSAATAQRILATKGKVTLSAGYRDGFAPIFSGDIRQVRKGRESPTDTYVHVRAATYDRAYNGAVVNKTLKAGSTAKDIVDACLASMKKYGVQSRYVAQALQQVKYPTPVVLYGMARNHLRMIALSNKCTWKIGDKGLTVLERDQALPGGVTVLNSATGLIGMPEQTELGIFARCLLNPAITIDSAVKIDERSVQRAVVPITSPGTTGDNLPRSSEPILPDVAADGLYKVVAMTTVGDTSGQEWYHDLVLMRQQGQLNQAQVDAGFGLPKFASGTPALN